MRETRTWEPSSSCKARQAAPGVGDSSNEQEKTSQTVTLCKTQGFGTPTLLNTAPSSAPSQSCDLGQGAHFYATKWKTPALNRHLWKLNKNLNLVMYILVLTKCSSSSPQFPLQNQVFIAPLPDLPKHQPYHQSCTRNPKEQLQIIP